MHNERQVTNVPNVNRWGGICAIAAGGLFIFLQLIHPAELVSSVTTARWAIVHVLTIVMCLFGAVGVAGIYLRQAGRIGWPGLAGALLLGLFWIITLAFVFVEAFILPVLATESPKFVEAYLGLVVGTENEVDLRALTVLWPATGILYLLGSLLLGFATFRAGTLSRRAGGLLAVGAVAAPLLSMFPHGVERMAAFPVGVALAWLGYSLLVSERSGPGTPP
ncbi:hypothetical protein [Cohnella sp. GCM10027633]|uniref:hypothetical protein n=1 Tax=unclassified Cohnella TaxID=2636738 RepID=UPI00363B70AA